MVYKNQQDMTSHEITEQPATSNRLYYNLRKDDETSMQKKGDAGLRHAQRRQLRNMFKGIISIIQIQSNVKFLRYER